LLKQLRIKIGQVYLLLLLSIWLLPGVAVVVITKAVEVVVAESFRDTLGLFQAPLTP
jgi:hypothetical protein